MTENPYVGVVADLLDPYLTHTAKNSSGGKPVIGGEYAIWWLKTHPGRWAMVGEGSTGMSIEMLRRVGLTHARRTSKTDGITRIYGQLPHPEAEGLTAALERRHPMEGILIPEFSISDFAWTPAELSEACQLARDNLFPVGR